MLVEVFGRKVWHSQKYFLHRSLLTLNFYLACTRFMRIMILSYLVGDSVSGVLPCFA